MKKTILLYLILLTFNISLSQDVLHFNDGTSKKGKVQSINKTVVRFLPNGTKRKVKRYTSKNIKKAIIVIDEKKVEFFYDKVPFLGRVLLGKLISGKANLYVTQKKIPSNLKSDFRKSFFGGFSNLYYGKLEGDSKYFDLNYDGAIVNKFKNRVSKYLASCPGLAAKIKNKELNIFDIVEIFETYNKCL